MIVEKAGVIDLAELRCGPGHVAMRIGKTPGTATKTHSPTKILMGIQGEKVVMFVI